MVGDVYIHAREEEEEEGEKGATQGMGLLRLCFPLGPAHSAMGGILGWALGEARSKIKKTVIKELDPRSRIGLDACASFFPPLGPCLHVFWAILPLICLSSCALPFLLSALSSFFESSTTVLDQAACAALPCWSKQHVDLASMAVNAGKFKSRLYSISHSN